MSDSYVQVPPDSTGKQVDAASLPVGGQTVLRQRIVIGDNSATAQYATVTGGALLVTGTFVDVDNTSATAGQAAFVPMGAMRDDVGWLQVAENSAGMLRMTTNRALHVSLRDASGNAYGSAGTTLAVNLAQADFTATVLLAAGTNNIGTINNISANVTVVNAAGTANIGAVSLAAGTSNIGTINNISAAVVLAAGANNVGSINNISATVTVAIAGYSPAIMSVSHGPKCVTCSTSAVVTLVSTPGAGASVYVTQLMVGNNSNSLTLARIGTSASANTVVQPLAAAGGGFVLQFDPPWKLSASEACLCSVKPAATDVYFTVNFFVAP